MVRDILAVHAAWHISQYNKSNDHLWIIIISVHEENKDLGGQILAIIEKILLPLL